MADQRKRSRAIQLPAAQHAMLQAMGISVPWIANADLARPLPGNPADSSESQAHGASPASHALNVLRSGDPGADRSTGKHVIASGVSDAHRSTGRSASGAIELSARDLNSKPGVSVDQVQDSSQTRMNEIRMLDMESLTRLIQGCDVCGELSRTRKHAVPGQGMIKPKLMVIGEAPGEQEDLEGLPFVGPSGKLLDNMLAAIGLSRTDSVFIANTIKCRPPANRNPRQEEIAACLPFLQRQIELLQPQAILAVGLFAAQTLLSVNAGVQALRQKTHFIENAGRRIPVVVTYHPAYLLRRPADKRMAWQDLKQVVALLQG